MTARLDVNARARDALQTSRSQLLYAVEMGHEAQGVLRLALSRLEHLEAYGAEGDEGRALLDAGHAIKVAIERVGMVVSAIEPCETLDPLRPYLGASEAA